MVISFYLSIYFYKFIEIFLIVHVLLVYMYVSVKYLPYVFVPYVFVPYLFTIPIRCYVLLCL